MEYDIIVVGGGHAGCEAAHASAKMGVHTALITSDISKLALAPCNPSIGGPAKGVVVREIDALGGIMGLISDKSMIQIKMLNKSKGPAVHSLRAQIDKDVYPINMKKLLKEMEKLELVEAMVKCILYNEERTQAIGVLLENGKMLYSKKIIITTGTYMDSYIINGNRKVHSGPGNTKTNKTLSDSLLSAGIELFRLKTGTPARLYTDSIDFSKAEIMPGDNEPLAFSFYKPRYLMEEDNINCWLIHTTPEVHKLINNNINKSAMYSGVIKGVGPRYCPSIEDKLVRFPDKKRHQLFLEPETKKGDTIYVQGFSTSMPHDIQDQMLSLLPGFENCRVQKYGYAIEYDAIRPEQLKKTLELKKIKNLYTAGQINGTSGYEEAAGQGIVAGINAVLSIKNEEPLLLDRTNSYIGLMIDDLITKGTDEPYRLLTSRSEFRLYLRHDNADIRLSKFGYRVGLLDDKSYNRLIEKKKKINELKQELKKFNLTPKNFPADLALKVETQPLEHGITAFDFIKRPNIITKIIKPIIGFDYDDEILKQVDIDIKYEGYIKKVVDQMERQHKLYKQKIPNNIDFKKVDNLALEAREKLNKMRPETIGLASQISGINPSDITVLQIHLEKMRRKNGY